MIHAFIGNLRERNGTDNIYELLCEVMGIIENNDGACGQGSVIPVRHLLLIDLNVAPL